MTGKKTPARDRRLTVAGKRYDLQLTTERILAFEEATDTGIFALVEQAAEGRAATAKCLTLFRIMAGEGALDAAAPAAPAGAIDSIAPADLHRVLDRTLRIAIADLGLGAPPEPAA